MDEGTTDILRFSIKAPCGTEDSIDYRIKSYIDGFKSDLNSSITKTTEVISDTHISVLKSNNNTINYLSEPINNDGRKHYLYSGYATSVTYTIRVNPGTSNEDVFGPSVIDDLTDIADKLNLNCG